MISTSMASDIKIEMMGVQNLADGGTMTDAELCRWLRKVLNKASKEITVEIKRLESANPDALFFPKRSNRF
jgi:hypothetical protein